jgi:hypothetical protein
MCDCKEHQEHIEQLRCAVKIARSSMNRRWKKLSQSKQRTAKFRAAYTEALNVFRAAKTELKRCGESV